MSKIVLEKNILRASAGMGLSLLGVVALCILGFGIAVLAVPDLVEGMNPFALYFILVGVVLGVLTFVLFIKSRISFQLIRSKDRVFSIKVNDSKEMKNISEPWEYFYHYDVIGRGSKKTRTLRLIFCQGGKYVLKISESLPKFTNIPKGWPEELSPSDLAKLQKMKKNRAKNKYAYMSSDLLGSVVRALQKEEESRAKKRAEAE